MAPRIPTPGTLALRGALDQNQPLARLLERARESSRRLQAVTGLLPDGLRQTVRAGPLDDDSWQLLVPNGSAAAKLRQLLPRLQAALAEAGWRAVEIRVKIQPQA